MNKRRGISWNLWFGITFRFHPLFTLLLLLSVVTGYVVEMLTLFGIVLIHEMGHVAAAKSFGWDIREVQLLPFGGVAVVEEAAGTPAYQEAAVALAGPLQNVWMMLVGYMLMLLGIIPPVWGQYFIEANLLIALFNLMPVLPLDGGKVMQAVIGLWLPYQKNDASGLHGQFNYERAVYRRVGLSPVDGPRGHSTEWAVDRRLLVLFQLVRMARGSVSLHAFPAAPRAAV